MQKVPTAGSYEDITMIRIFSALIMAIAANCISAAEQSPQLAASAPARHVVVPGDTLWDISAKFLKDPWRWPDIWRMNKVQIRNPHRIYPGDVIVLERDGNGNPFLRVETKLSPQIHAEALREAIPPIPPNVIEPFISTPLVVEAGGLDSAPRIIATQQDRVFLGNGDTAYVENANPAQKQWQVYRNGKPLRDPEDPSRILGYEAFYLGTASQVKAGNPAIFEVVTAKQEIGRGDRLVPAVRPALIDYVPHKPDVAIDGRIISVYGGVGSGGRLSIVALNKGSTDSIEVGHVLALERNRTVVDRDENDRKINVVIPALRFGLAFVFRTFEHISYALVVQSDGTIEVNDYARTP